MRPTPGRLLPVLGKFTSHLVVGTLGSSELLVLSLPDLALVCVHALVPADFSPESTWGFAAPVKLMGLAADPCGNAIAVYAAARVAVGFRIHRWDAAYGARDLRKEHTSKKPAPDSSSLKNYPSCYSTGYVFCRSNRKYCKYYSTVNSKFTVTERFKCRSGKFRT